MTDSGSEADGVSDLAPALVTLSSTDAVDVIARVEAAAGAGDELVTFA